MVNRRKFNMSREAWGRWGADDEVGASRLIGKREVLAAAGLVREGRVLSLAQPLSGKTPVPASRTGLLHFMDRDGGDYAAGARRSNGFQFADDSVVMPLHIGTHIDALCHAWYDDQLYNGHPSSEITSTRGTRRCGIDKLPPLVARGVLLDLVEARGAPLPDGTSVGRDELVASAERAGAILRPGDVVLIRTGWLEAQAGKPARDVDFNAEPGIDVDAALWLAAAGVSSVGADNFAIEVMPFPAGTTFPVHQRLIRDHGITLIEGLVLRELAEQAPREFLFVAAPLPIVGGTGSPLTPLAVF